MQQPKPLPPASAPAEPSTSAIEAAMNEWLESERETYRAVVEASLRAAYAVDRPAPPHGLTVERLAALLREMDAKLIGRTGMDMAYQELAAWLLPRLKEKP